MNWRTIFLPAVRLYWRIVQPRTYGVKALILQPDGNGRVLLVRHSYGKRRLWNLPGGGFNPKRESPIEAAVREVSEELRVQLIDPRELFLYQTTTEGKRDAVNVILGSVAEENFSVGKEIAEYRWENPSAVLADGDIARVARRAVEHLRQQ